MIICGMRSVTASAPDAVTAETVAAAAAVSSRASGEGRALARFHLCLIPAKPSVATGDADASRPPCHYR